MKVRGICGLIKGSDLDSYPGRDKFPICSRLSVKALSTIIRTLSKMIRTLSKMIRTLSKMIRTLSIIILPLSKIIQALSKIMMSHIYFKNTLDNTLDNTLLINRVYFYYIKNILLFYILIGGEEL